MMLADDSCGAVMNAFYVNMLTALASLVIGIMIPILISYVNNISTRSSSLAAIFAFLLIICATIAVPVGFAIKLGGPWAEWLIVAVATTSWVQRSFLPWRHGAIEGYRFKWPELSPFGWLKEVATAPVIAAILVGASVWGLGGTAPLLGAIILISLADLLFGMRRIPAIARQNLTRPSYHLLPAHPLRFSRHRNVIMIIVDSFQSDIFAELSREHAWVRDGLAGFTFFADTMSAFAKTTPSIPSILTGDAFRNEGRFLEHLESQSRDGKFIHDILAGHGFEVSLQPLNHELAFLLGDKVIRQSVLGALEDIRSLLPIVLFSACPDPFRRWFHDNHISHLMQLKGNRSLALLAGKGRVELVDQPCFHFLHLEGVHIPLTHDENLNSRIMPISRENYKRQATGVLRAVIAYLDLLRAQGVMDNAMIAVMGDHGAGMQGQEISATYSAADIPVSCSRLQAAAAALLLLKPLGPARSAMTTSDCQASLLDVKNTVLADMGLTEGPSLFALDQAERTRPFFHYGDLSGDGALFPLLAYEVRGPSARIDAWKFIGEIMPDGQLVPPQTPALPAGVELNVCEISQRSALIPIGFRFREPGEDFIWSDGKNVLMQFSVDLDIGPICVIFGMAPFLFPGWVEKQRVRMFSAGERVFDGIVSRFCQIKVVIPKDHLRDGVVRIWIEIPDAMMPFRFGENDRNELGLQFRTLMWDRVASLAFGVSQPIRSSESIELWLSHGWKQPEANFAWTAARSAGLQLPLGGELDGRDVELRFNLVPLSAKGAVQTQRIGVSGGGRLLAHWEVSRPGWYTVVVPNALVISGVLALDLDLPDAISLHDLGISPDVTLLGVQLHQIVCKPVVRLLPGIAQPTRAGADVESWFGPGWKPPEKFFTWTAAQKATLHLPVEVPLTPTHLLVEMRMIPLTANGQVYPQRISVDVADSRVADLMVDGNRWYGFGVHSSSLSEGGMLNCQILLPDARSLDSVGVAPDPTLLGVQLHELSYRPVSPLPWGVSVPFRAGEGVESWLDRGWKRPEAMFTWTNGKQSSLRLPLVPVDDLSALKVRMRVAPLKAAGKLDAQKVRLSAGGQQWAEWTVTGLGWHEVMLPGNLLVGGMLNLILDVPDACSLADLGLADNQTILGIQLHELQIDPVTGSNPGSGSGSGHDEDKGPAGKPKEITPASVELPSPIPAPRTLYDGKFLTVLFHDICDTSSEYWVTFSSFQTPEPFGLKYLTGRQCRALYIVPKLNEWYQHEEIWEALAVCREVLEAAGVRPIVYGSSMGGFAALAFARELNARIVLSGCPQISIDPRLVGHFDVRWQDIGKRVSYVRADARDGLFSDAEIYVIFDSLHREDRQHVAMLAGYENIRNIAFPVAGHGVLHTLNDLKLLRPLIEAVITPGQADAIKDIQRLYRERSRTTNNYFHAIGEFYLTSKSYGRAIRFLRKAIEMKPSFHLSHSFLGKALWANGDREAAIESVRKACQCAPAIGGHRVHLGLMLLDAARFDEAVDVFNEAIRDFPDMPAAYTGLAGTMMRRQPRNLDAIAKLYEAALSINPRVVQWHIDAANIEALRGEWNRCRHWLQRATALEPGHPDIARIAGMIPA